jgi:hypothetical protein
MCELLVALEKRLPLVLEGKEPATPGDLLQMALICQQYQQRSATAARLYQDAFKARPALAEDAAQHRYNAACSAALAGVGKGEDAGKLTAEEYAKLRTQARAWLRADLDGYTKQTKNAKPATLLQTEQILSHWQADADFAGVRDPEELAGLLTEERRPWNELWADVAALLKDVRSRITDTRMAARSLPSAPPCRSGSSAMSPTSPAAWSRPARTTLVTCRAPATSPGTS